MHMKEHDLLILERNTTKLMRIRTGRNGGIENSPCRNVCDGWELCLANGCEREKMGRLMVQTERRFGVWIFILWWDIQREQTRIFNLETAQVLNKCVRCNAKM